MQRSLETLLDHGEQLPSLTVSKRNSLHLTSISLSTFIKAFEQSIFFKDVIYSGDFLGCTFFIYRYIFSIFNQSIFKNDMFKILHLFIFQGDLKFFGPSFCISCSIKSFRFRWMGFYSNCCCYAAISLFKKLPACYPRINNSVLRKKSHCLLF